MTLSEKLQKFALDHEAYFNSAAATSLLSALSQSPAVYVDASSTEAAATEAKEKAQADIKLSENQCAATSTQALNGCYHQTRSVWTDLNRGVTQMLHWWLFAVESNAVPVKKTSKAKKPTPKSAKRKKKVPRPAESQIMRPR